MQNQSESEFLSGVGKRIALFRKQRGLSQEHVALNASITQCYLSDAERGKRNITLKVLYSLARVLSVEPIQLLDFRSDVTSESSSSDFQGECKSTNEKNL